MPQSKKTSKKPSIPKKKQPKKAASKYNEKIVVNASFTQLMKELVK